MTDARVGDVHVWRVMAVDDEPPALLAIEQLFRDVPDFVLVLTTTDSVTAADLIRAERPDVLLLDIQMPGTDGFGVLEAIGEPQPAVVFLTAYHQHAIAAFDAQAQDYLLKPVDPARFQQTLSLLRRRLTERITSRVTPQLRAMLRYLDASTAPPGLSVARAPSGLSRITIRHDGRAVLLDPLSIDRVESDNNDLRIFVGRERYEIRETLTHFATQLPSSHFARVHRSALVNVSRVRAVEPYLHGDYVLHMTDGTRVITGRSYRDVVRTVFRLT
jgi:two-component system LytT family response regulator